MLAAGPIEQQKSASKQRCHCEEVPKILIDCQCRDKIDEDPDWHFDLGFRIDFLR